MALTYATLQTRILSLVERADAETTAEIPYHIELVEADMNRRLKARARYARVTAPLDTELSAVPADFAGVRSFKIDGGNRLVLITEQEMADLRNTGAPATGEPMFFAVVGAEFRFYPTPDTSYTAELTYRQKVPALTAVNTTNWVLTAHPDAYLYGAAMHTAVYLQDGDRAVAFRGLYEQAVDQIAADDELQTFGGRRSLRRKPFPTF